MEHRLISGGGQWLPFARSCIAKLKRLGLPYAAKSFEIDGASIKVRIEPGHEYITLSGAGLLGWKIFPTSDSAPSGYVSDPATEPGETPEQVPMTDEIRDGEYPGVSENSRTNPTTFIATPKGNVREESTAIDGGYFWSNGGGERLLFTSGLVSHRQVRVSMYEGEEGKGGPQVIIGTGAIAGKYVIVASAQSDNTTKFFAKPLAAFRGARTGDKLYDAILVGEAPAAKAFPPNFEVDGAYDSRTLAPHNIKSTPLRWEFSPDGLNAIALESGRPSIRKTPTVPTDPWNWDDGANHYTLEGSEFCEYTDANRNSFKGVQHIHRVVFTPVEDVKPKEPPFTMVASKETRGGALLKSVPTSTFTMKDATIDLRNLPHYCDQITVNVAYATAPWFTPPDFSAATFTGECRPEGVDPWYATLYDPEDPITFDVTYSSDLWAVPSSLMAFLPQQPLVADSGWEAVEGSGGGLFVMRYTADGVQYANQYITNQYPAFTFEVHMTVSQDSEVKTRAVPARPYFNTLGVRVVVTPTEDAAARDDPRILALPEYFHNYLDTSDLVAASAVREPVGTLTVGAPPTPYSITYQNYVAAKFWPHHPLHTESTISIEATYKFPIVDKRTSSWERTETTHYEGTRIVAVSYTREGAETFLEIRGRRDDKVTCLIKQASWPHDPAQKDGNFWRGRSHEYVTSGSCGYDLVLDGKVLTSHTVTADSVRDETDAPNFLGRVEATTMSTVSEKSFTIEDFDLPCGLVLTYESARTFNYKWTSVVPPGQSAPSGIGAGTAVIADTVRVYSKSEGVTLFEYPEYTAELMNNLVGAGQDDRFRTAINGGSGESGKYSPLYGVFQAEGAVPISGVQFGPTDFRGREHTFNGLAQAGLAKFATLFGRDPEGWVVEPDSSVGVRRWMAHEAVIPEPKPTESIVRRPKEVDGQLAALTDKRWLVVVRPAAYGEVRPPDKGVFHDGTRLESKFEYADPNTVRFGVSLVA